MMVRNGRTERPSGRRSTGVPLLALFVVTLAVADVSINEPDAVVDGLHTALIDFASSGESMDLVTRSRIIAPAIDASHDFETIARLAGGRFWPDLSDEDRALFRDAFRRASIAAYASRFSSAEGILFDKAQTVQQDDSQGTVRSHLVRSDGSTVTFDYVLQRRGDRWRIVTILVEGVSDLALQRADLAHRYATSGLPAVLEHLEVKAANP